MGNHETKQDHITRINAEAGDARARFFMAKLCFEDDSPNGGEQVLHWLTLSAEGGDPWALEALASIFLDGKIAYPNGKEKWPAPKDPARAAVYLERLAELGWSKPWSAGHPNSLRGLRDAPETLLARMYLTGEGVAKDVGRGLWLHHLATIGLSHEDASMKELAAMYLRGAEGLRRDLEKAAYWMLKYDIRADRPACGAEHLREHFLSNTAGRSFGHTELCGVRETDEEAFIKGLDLYLSDQVEREWFLWIGKCEQYNNRFDRGYDEEGSFVQGKPNPYEKLRTDKKRADEYFKPLWNKPLIGDWGV